MSVREGHTTKHAARTHVCSLTGPDLMARLLASDIPEAAAVIAERLLAQGEEGMQLALPHNVDLLSIADRHWHQGTKLPMLSLAVRRLPGEAGCAQRSWHLATHGSDAQRAIALRALSSAASATPETAPCASQALQAIAACSEPTRPEELRAAAAAALARVPDPLPRPDWWRLAATLLQDDDAAVRRETVGALAAALDDQELLRLCDAAATARFARLVAERCPARPDLLLASCVWDPERNDMVKEDAGVKRVYQVDPENTYADAVRLAQVRERVGGFSQNVCSAYEERKMCTGVEKWITASTPFARLFSHLAVGGDCTAKCAAQRARRRAYGLE